MRGDKIRILSFVLSAFGVKLVNQGIETLIQLPA